MLIKTVVENTAITSQYKSIHGLSFYIETKKHKILFDLGPNNLFLKNAKRLGIDIADIDIVIISHGHADHGGALSLFLQNNNKAKIYIRESAFDKHIIKVCGCRFNVGLKHELKTNPRIIFTKKQEYIDDKLALFSGVTTTHGFRFPKNMFTVKGNKLIVDDFSHEQNLIVMQGEKTFLFAGCAHSGIINIKETAEQLIGRKISFIFGGFHLYNHITKRHAKRAIVEDIAFGLQGCKSYTCHCTGKWAYRVLKDKLKNQISYLSTGAELHFNT